MTIRGHWWWLPLAAAEVAVGVVGFSHILHHPELVDIPAFTAMLTTRGIPPVVLISTFLILPSILAMVASVWIFAGSRHGTFPVWFGLGMVAIFLFQGGAGTGLADLWGWPGSIVDTLLLFGGVTVLLLFPNGRWQPRWSRWLLLLLLGLASLGITVTQRLRRFLAEPDLPLDTNMRSAIAVMITFFGLALISQTIRYRRFSTQVERLQARWVLLGAVLWVIPVVIASALNLWFPIRALAGWLVGITAISAFVIPVAFAIAVTKNRLYDLSKVVSRTVTYAVLVGAAGLLYVGGVALIRLVIPFSGSLAVAASTLGTVALISPLHHRVRNSVDRRFNRARYDAQSESSAFGGRLQSTLDVDDLVRDLIGVVGKTMQPVSAVIWTRSAAD